MKKLLLLAAAATLTASVAPALQAAEAAAKPAAAAAPSPEEQAAFQRAAVIMRTFMIVFQGKDVPQQVKGKLLSCLYNNKLSAITAATNEALKKDATFKDSDTAAIYRTAAGVCGLTFKKTETAATPAAKKK